MTVMTDAGKYIINFLKSLGFYCIVINNMSTKGYKSTDGATSSYIDLEKLEAFTALNTTKPSDPNMFRSYNDYAADQVDQFPEILLAFMQYDGGDDAMFYLQLIWMSDFYKARKKQSV